LTAHLHLVPKVRMSGVNPPFLLMHTQLAQRQL
jgi:hypothetical protein